MFDVLLLEPDIIRFGGALGIDTIALEIACSNDCGAVLEVVVPFLLDNQPAKAIDAVHRCQSQIVVTELRLPPSKGAYLRRNDYMLNGADLFVAFTDGRQSGGTWYTINRAEKLDIPTLLIEVLSRHQNPRYGKELGAPVYCLDKYVSQRSGVKEWKSVLIRDLKKGVVKPSQGLVVCDR